ncbi:ABC transporter, ATP-binding protein [gamma proteobacterium HdN1]|nr:ABC transporter, ATP-binding protein [gamma proteobacterium HdN1]
MALITLRQVSIAFGGPSLLDHVDLGIETNERIAIVGRNGEGKSTLLKLLDGTLKADDGEIIRKSALKVATLQQEVPEASGSATVFDIVAEGFGPAAALLRDYEAATESGDLNLLSQLQERLEAVGGWQMHGQVTHWLSRLGLDPHEAFAPLSGGRKRRVLLARALVTEPDLLLLDEPTNHLDIASIDWLEKFLRDYRGSLVFISHDRAFLSALATRIVELDRGRLFDHPGSYEKYLENRASRFAVEGKVNSEFDKRLSQEEKWIRKGVEARRTRNEGRVRALIAMRREHAERRERVGKVKLAIGEAEKSGKRVLEAQNLSYSVKAAGAREPRCLIRDFSTTLWRGDRVGLVGENGVGKTTLVRLLLGQIAPTSGHVEHGTKLEVAYFDQLRAALDEEKTVFENVVEGSDWVEINGQKKHALGYLQDFLFSPARARTPVKALSGGERNRLLLAKLFTRPANLLVLDEPTNDLDLETLELLEEVLMTYSGTLLLISHDRAFLDNVVTEVWVFDGQGGVDEYVGGYQDYLRQRPAASIQQASQASTQEAAAAPAPTAKPTEPRKRLSYKEQRELEQIPAQIDALEQEQARLEAQLQDPDFFVRAPQEASNATARLGEIETALMELLERWDSLGG